MNKKIYEFLPDDKKGCIRIEANIEYSSLSMVNSDSPLLNKNVSIKKTIGKNWHDIVQFEDSSFFVVSEKLKQIFDREKISGVELVKVNVTDAPVNYYLPIVKSIAGPILNLEALNSYETEKIEFDNSTYDGSNIFSLQDTLLFLCDEIVKKAIDEETITNIKFIEV